LAQETWRQRASRARAHFKNGFAEIIFASPNPVGSVDAQMAVSPHSLLIESESAFIIYLYFKKKEKSTVVVPG
jgi:hypothetical protein